MTQSCSLQRDFEIRRQSSSLEPVGVLAWRQQSCTRLKQAFPSLYHHANPQQVGGGAQEESTGVALAGLELDFEAWTRFGKVKGKEGGILSTFLA